MDKKLIINNLKLQNEEFELFVPYFSISNNEIIIIQGPNGSGKSSLIKSLFDVSKFIDNIKFEYEFETFSDAARKGYIFIPQNIPIIEGISYKKLWTEMFEYFPAFDFNLIPDNIKYLIEKDIGTCSGGENKLLEFIPWLFFPFEILFLDEIDSSLDEQNRLFIFSECKKLILKHKSSIVIITHQNKEYLNQCFKNINIKYYIIENNRLYENI
jgi:ABC-type multidrug transport system ATPase subunit